jgi:D-alanyl-lipoteichoic acid acyltransferase DltB (MBOAT superfamily)
VASYVFYGWWDWRFLGLIAFSTVVDFFVGLRIASANERELGPEAPAEARSRSARRWLFVSLAVNLGLLGYFKYANFFIESWIDAWAAAGVTMHASSLQIILPVGISFYTFQTLSYSIDIYRRTMPPTRDPIAFAAFVSFFPQLVAGPIERASHLLPQIERRRTFDPELAASGLKLMVWGMFKKIVVADTCAHYAEAILSGNQHMPAPMMWTGLILFSFQIYGDFSGYSDIAIGTARLFGIRLSTNFKMPYFSRDIAEFWRRWHISLSTWFRDYLYIPLGGSRGGRWQAVRNTFAIFLISGLWHGANWTFVAWGALHALFFLPLLLMGRNRRHVGDGFRLRQIPSIFLTFAMATLAWAFFRAESISQAVHFISQSIGGRMKLPSQVWEVWSAVGWMIGLLLLVEALLISPSVQKKLLRLHGIWWALGLNALTWVIAVHLRDNPPSFIYFQF